MGRKILQRDGDEVRLIVQPSYEEVLCLNQEERKSGVNKSSVGHTVRKMASIPIEAIQQFAAEKQISMPEAFELITGNEKNLRLFLQDNPQFGV